MIPSMRKEAKSKTTKGTTTSKTLNVADTGGLGPVSVPVGTCEESGTRHTPVTFDALPLP